MSVGERTHTRPPLCPLPSIFRVVSRCLSMEQEGARINIVFGICPQEAFDMVV